MQRQEEAGADQTVAPPRNRDRPCPATKSTTTQPIAPLRAGSKLSRSPTKSIPGILLAVEQARMASMHERRLDRDAWREPVADRQLGLEHDTRAEVLPAAVASSNTGIAPVCTAMPSSRLHIEGAAAEPPAEPGRDEIGPARRGERAAHINARAGRESRAPASALLR